MGKVDNFFKIKEISLYFLNYTLNFDESIKLLNPLLTYKIKRILKQKDGFKVWIMINERDTINYFY